MCIDVGAGTTDILLTQPGEALENAFKLVVPAATQVVGRRIAAATARGATVVLRGPVMGGGASTAAMKRHLAAGAGFVATEEAVLTFADDPERARRLGVQVVSDEEVDALLAAAGDGAVEVRTGDLDVESLLAAFARLEVEPGVDAVAVAVQDHGFSPGGSNRVFRFGLWARAVAERRPLGALFYDEDRLPAKLTRLRAALEAARRLAAGGAGDEEAGGAPARLLVADTGPAALYGALPEGRADAVLVNVGNGHTVCAVAREGRLAGVFEHHTRRLDGPGLVERLRRFLAGGLGNDEVRDDGGHGAVLDGPVPDGVPLIATGPRRTLLEGSPLPFEFAAPHGDMMLTGCFGLLRALEERAGRQR
ncbi:MAG: pyruvate formate lyase-activating protein [Thermoleophilia bacterium]|nr:pyruvate formate lyase-activating protein [Thermoleophilia bacterium]